MRAALLCVLLSFGVGVIAQQNPDTQQPSVPAGHTRPTDIEVLTGKSSTATPASSRAVSGAYAAYGYYPYSANVPLFTGGQFNSTNRSGDQRYFRNFGAFNPRGFLFFGSGRFGTRGHR